MDDKPRELLNIHCSVCGHPLKEDDETLMDYYYVLSHHYCSIFPARLVKDIGTFREIAERQDMYWKDNKKEYTMIYAVPDLDK